MKSENEINYAIDNYSDTIKRICFIYLKNEADTEDIFQTVFLKYATSTIEFVNEDHKKAWFIKVTINQCKDLLKNFFRSHTISIDELIKEPEVIENEHQEVLEAVLSLPQKYRDVIYLHYYEGYSAPEIADILHKNVNTVYTLINRSKQMLRDKLGGDVIV